MSSWTEYPSCWLNYCRFAQQHDASYRPISCGRRKIEGARTTVGDGEDEVCRASRALRVWKEEDGRFDLPELSTRWNEENSRWSYQRTPATTKRFWNCSSCPQWKSRIGLHWIIAEKVWRAQHCIDSFDGSQDDPHIVFPSILAQDRPNVVKQMVVVIEKLKEKSVAAPHLDRISDDFKAGNLIRCPVGQCTACEKIIPGKWVKLGNYTFEVHGLYNCRSANTCFMVTLETGERQGILNW